VDVSPKYSKHFGVHRGVERLLNINSFGDHKKHDEQHWSTRHLRWSNIYQRDDKVDVKVHGWDATKLWGPNLNIEGGECDHEAIKEG